MSLTLVFYILDLRFLTFKLENHSVRHGYGTSREACLHMSPYDFMSRKTTAPPDYELLLGFFPLRATHVDVRPGQGTILSGLVEFCWNNLIFKVSKNYLLIWF